MRTKSPQDKMLTLVQVHCFVQPYSNIYTLVGQDRDQYYIYLADQVR